jgi:hypothetical protein
MVKVKIDLDREEALSSAKMGDYRRLAARIRKGIASPQERKLAAKLILKAPKPAAHRPRSYDLIERDIDIFDFVQDRLDDGKEAAVTAAMKRFSLGRSAIYEILKRIEAAHGARTRSWLGK